MSDKQSANTDRAAEARRGLIDSVAGKAREFAGAVTGKSELAEEGQLQQADANARKQANADEALADATANEAMQDLHDRSEAATKDKRAANLQAVRQEEAARRAAGAEKVTAEARAQQKELNERRAAEVEADAIARESAVSASRLAEQARHTENAAHDQQARLNAEAADAEHRAQQLRAEADSE